MSEHDARDSLIAKQALEIEELRGLLADREVRLSRIVLRLVGVGGPLNDNVLGFDSSQRKYLHGILEIAEVS